MVRKRFCQPIIMCIKCYFFSSFIHFVHQKKKLTEQTFNIPEFATQRCRPRIKQNCNEIFLLVCCICTCQNTHTETVFLQLANNIISSLINALDSLEFHYPQETACNSCVCILLFFSLYFFNSKIDSHANILFSWNKI